MSPRFNMTPIIDIVFLLIIFFMLVCQFIVAENFEVTVPDDITAATSGSGEDRPTTVTVMFEDSGYVSYAVGSERIASAGDLGVSSKISAAIDEQLQLLPAQRRVVCLRVDRDISFRDSQPALAGISQSTATDMKLAVIKHKLPQ